MHHYPQSTVVAGSSNTITSVMSEDYLEQTHESFVSEDDKCRILVAISGESVVSINLMQSNMFCFTKIFNRESTFQMSK